jgi:hypothetical protein
VGGGARKLSVDQDLPKHDGIALERKTYSECSVDYRPAVPIEIGVDCSHVFRDDVQQCLFVLSIR